MKKLLCIMAALTIMMVPGVHAEGDDPGNLGVGLRGIVLQDGFFMPAATIRWAPQPIGGEILIGQGNDNTDGGPEISMLSLAGKFLYGFIERENSTAYGGVELGIDLIETTVPGATLQDETATHLGFLFGYEWRLTELPELGLNCEVGYYFSTWEDDSFAPAAEGDHNGLNFSFGTTYYF